MGSSEKNNIKIEIIIIIFAFLLLILISLGTRIHHLFQIEQIRNTTNSLYKHPLKVSNASLTITSDIYKIHSDLKNIILHIKKQERKDILEKIKKSNYNIYENLQIIEDNILGEEGKTLYISTRELFRQFEPIQNKVIQLINNNEVKKAIFIIKNEETKLILDLEYSLSILYEYAQNKALVFKNRSLKISRNVEITNLILLFITFIIFGLIAYFIIKRISNLIYRLDQNKNKLENILSEAPYPIMVHNEDGKILLLNKVWRDLAGYDYEQINTTDKWIKKAYHRDEELSKEEHEKFYSIKRRTDEGEYTINTNNNKKLIWKFSSSPLGIIDKKRTIVTSAVDMTEIREKDNFILVQSRHAAMGEMISMIAHQWRQPITTISMSANNIILDIELEETNENSLKKQSENILKQTEHLSKTIDDFRDFFKIDKVISEINLVDIIKNVLKIIEASLKSNNIELKFNNQSTIQIYGYKRELMQVLINLINNSKDSILTKNSKDGVIDIDIFNDDKFININICDNGTGINNETLNKIFEPYFTTKGESNGTGLGLYMSKVIIEEHFKGTIKAFNNKNEGACFEIKIPLKTN